MNTADVVKMVNAAFGGSIRADQIEIACLDDDDPEPWYVRVTEVIPGDGESAECRHFVTEREAHAFAAKVRRDGYLND